jgi:two-component system chemotaxis response regulator CheY
MKNSHYNVLVVEDSPAMRQLIVLALMRIPAMRVVEAQDGLDGLSKLSAGWFDLVIIDINMPVMDGLKLVSVVRNNDLHKNVPILIITTQSNEEDRKRAMELVVNDYLTKPVQAQQVIKTVKNLLNIRS